VLPDPDAAPPVNAAATHDAEVDELDFAAGWGNNNGWWVPRPTQAPATPAQAPAATFDPWQPTHTASHNSWDPWAAFQ